MNDCGTFDLFDAVAIVKRRRPAGLGLIRWRTQSSPCIASETPPCRRRRAQHFFVKVLWWPGRSPVSPAAVAVP